MSEQDIVEGELKIIKRDDAVEVDINAIFKISAKTEAINFSFDENSRWYFHDLLSTDNYYLNGQISELEFDNFKAGPNLVPAYRVNAQVSTKKLDLKVDAPIQSAIDLFYQAAPNNCHDNARFFVEENPGHQYQDGWLCIIGEGSPLAMFAAHTVVMDSAGNYFDVTPVFSLDPRPFLPANIDEDSFAELIQYLFATRNSSVFSVNI